MNNEANMEKRAIIDKNTPLESEAEKEASTLKFARKVMPPLRITDNELDRVDVSAFEAHLSKRLADKVQAETKKS